MIGFAEPCGRLDECIENRLQVECGAADGFQDLGSGSLLLQSLPELSDIANRSNQAQNPPIAVAYRCRAVTNPAPFSRLVENAVLAGEVRRASLEMGYGGLTVLAPILGMNARHPIRRRGLPSLEPEHFQQSRRELEMVWADGPLVNSFSDRVEN